MNIEEIKKNEEKKKKKCITKRLSIEIIIKI